MTVDAPPEAATSARLGSLGRLGAVVYGLLDAGVIIAPAVAVGATGARAGIDEGYSVDLLVASGVIAVVHGVVAGRRLVDEARTARRRADIWIASLNALVVLALTSTLLITAILAGFANQHAWLSNQGAPVVLLWAGVQLVAVVLAELTGRAVYRWLEETAGPAGAAPDPLEQRLRRRRRRPA